MKEAVTAFEALWLHGKILVGARFSAPIQTGSGAHPASYTMGTGVSFPGVKWPGHGVDHTPPFSAEVKERVELYLYSLSGHSWHVLGRTLPLPLPATIRRRSEYLKSAFPRFDQHALCSSYLSNRYATDCNRYLRKYKTSIALVCYLSIVNLFGLRSYLTDNAVVSIVKAKHREVQ
jgi:hypothetical protein